MNNIANLFIILSFTSFLGVNIEHREYKKVHRTGITKSQEKTYLIAPNRVGVISKGMTVNDVIKVIPKDQIQKKIGYGEFLNDTYDDYEIYDSLGNHILTITPKTQSDSSSKINRVLIVSSRCQTKEGIGLNSTYSELLKSYPVEDYAPDMEHVVLTVDSLNARFSIKKTELETNWWNKERKEIDINKIPSESRFDSISIWWN